MVSEIRGQPQLGFQDMVVGREYEALAAHYAAIIQECAGKCSWTEAGWAKTLADGTQYLVYGALGGALKPTTQGLSNGAKDSASVANAFADTRKFSDYIFKSGADHGKDAVFKTLGYTADDSAALSKLWQQQAAEKYAKGEFKLGKVDQYGQRIDIEIALPGKGVEAGKVSYLRSGWMIQPDGSLKLNTPFSGFTRNLK